MWLKMRYFKQYGVDARLLDPSYTHAESWQRLPIEGLRFEDP